MTEETTTPDGLPREAIFFTTVRIESDAGVGTAFAFGYEWDNEQGEHRSIEVLVTNKHVIAGAATGNLFFTFADEHRRPQLGEAGRYWWKGPPHDDRFENLWHGHPDEEVDITIMPLRPWRKMVERSGREIYCPPIYFEAIPGLQELSESRAIEEVLIVGYPLGLYDEVNLIPVARRGITATPLWFDYNGRPQFLVDAAIFPGSSGSPVVIYDTIRGRFRFLGVVASVFEMSESGLVEAVPVPTRVELRVTMSHKLGIGVVFKASTVLETIFDFLRVEGEMPPQQIA